jgi:hypothetical protein
MSEYEKKMEQNRRSVPQAGDTDVEKKRKELKLKQAEAAGVYSLDKPMPLSPSVGADIDMDKDPEEEGMGAISRGDFGDEDFDTDEDIDIPALEQDVLYMKRGIKSRRIAAAKNARDAERKRRQLRQGIGGGGPTGPTGPKGPTAGETNTGIYAQHLPGDLEGEALTAAAEDAARTQYDKEFDGKIPSSRTEVTVDGQKYDKEVYSGGETFLVPHEGNRILRGHNQMPPRKKFEEKYEFKDYSPAFFHFEALKEGLFNPSAALMTPDLVEGDDS